MLFFNHFLNEIYVYLHSLVIYVKKSVNRIIRLRREWSVLTVTKENP